MGSLGSLAASAVARPTPTVESPCIISGPDIVKLELGTGVPIVYNLNADSTVASKDMLI